MALETQQKEEQTRSKHTQKNKYPDGKKNLNPLHT